ncbi:hypothetical protein WOLCODRAFT_162897 [Wolfiporia cocos MD-104 SS10]|uniref:Uncharacterized protein n=1 Tax=Wolfiporia cocos (strain MD-104) TaxID=742152 RepID=A0A2H3JMT5_WOLCO|nr:hypothetical protein WOLCODRAFT_162897 [Wolfiporia cocos MD-104 SS10]
MGGGCCRGTARAGGALVVRPAVRARRGRGWSRAGRGRVLARWHRPMRGRAIDVRRAGPHIARGVDVVPCPAPPRRAPRRPRVPGRPSRVGSLSWRQAPCVHAAMPRMGMNLLLSAASIVPPRRSCHSPRCTAVDAPAARCPPHPGPGVTRPRRPIRAQMNTLLHALSARQRAVSVPLSRLQIRPRPLPEIALRRARHALPRDPMAAMPARRTSCAVAKAPSPDDYSNTDMHSTRLPHDARSSPSPHRQLTRIDSDVNLAHIFCLWFAVACTVSCRGKRSFCQWPTAIAAPAPALCPPPSPVGRNPPPPTAICNPSSDPARTFAARVTEAPICRTLHPLQSITFTVPSTRPIGLLYAPGPRAGALLARRASQLNASRALLTLKDLTMRRGPTL